MPTHRLGINGDPLPDGKLDLPELLETPTADEQAWARDFIGQRRWKEAVTYRKTAPHEYTVREWQPDESAQRQYDQFVEMIRRFGLRGLLLSNSAPLLGRG